MIDPFLTYNGVQSHLDDLRAQACMSRLAAEATCCKATGWQRIRELLTHPAAATDH